MSFLKLRTKHKKWTDDLYFSTEDNVFYRKLSETSKVEGTYEFDGSKLLIRWGKSSLLLKLNNDRFVSKDMNIFVLDQVNNLVNINKPKPVPNPVVPEPTRVVPEPVVPEPTRVVPEPVVPAVVPEPVVPAVVPEPVVPERASEVRKETKSSKKSSKNKQTEPEPMSPYMQFSSFQPLD